MEQLNTILKEIDKSKIKSIKVRWEKTFKNKAFPKITIKLFK